MAPLSTSPDQAKALVRLCDYRPYPFRIPTIDLDVVIGERQVQVTSVLRIEPRSDQRLTLSD
jgi:hypothetical protein